MKNRSIPFDQKYATEQLRRSTHPVRKFVKGFYLRNILKHIQGATLDFGCGAGQLLEKLPPGSMGLELNPYLVDELQAKGLKVHQSSGELIDFELAQFPDGSFKTLVISHVLEHLTDPIAALRSLLGACRRLGVDRVIIVVPGARGYSSDSTHKTFINKPYIDQKMGPEFEGYKKSNLYFFPGPWEKFGNHFIFNEMIVILDRR